MLPLALSIAALVISIIGAAWSIFHGGLGKGISGYDFSTPAKAMDSSLAINLNTDIRAMMEMERVKSGKKLKEKRDTLKVHRDAEYQGKKILFISFNENGIEKHEVEGFEKDAESGMWFPAYVSKYSMTDAPLKKSAEDWEKTGATPD